MNVPLTPIRCLYRGVDLYGKKTGVVSGDRRFTYAEFGERCERLAVGLLSAGVQPGDRVAYLSFNTHQLLEGYFAPLLARAIVMPLNVRLTPAELTGILNHAEPRIVIYETDFAPLVEHLRQACPAVQRWIEVGEPYEELLSCGRIDRPDSFSIDENAIAELFYTSGSTGTPKGVMLSHRTLYLHALSCLATFVQRRHQVELHTIPLFHANGWGRAQYLHHERAEAGDGAPLRSRPTFCASSRRRRPPAWRWSPPWPTPCSTARRSASSISPACSGSCSAARPLRPS